MLSAGGGGGIPWVGWGGGGEGACDAATRHHIWVRGPLCRVPLQGSIFFG